jgi:predicted alpha-1,2-mannosidase
MGSNEYFTTKLDSLFQLAETQEGTGFVSDVTGLIGQYAHGNEPSHHVAYLYALAGKPWKTQRLVNEIIKTKYINDINGLCGNDDCGQMSAWYIFSNLGFYPVNPCGGEYVLGAPQIEKGTIILPGGKSFSVEAVNFSEENIYVQSVELNGEPYDKKTIFHQDVMNGGTLKFVMGNQPKIE